MNDKLRTMVEREVLSQPGVKVELTGFPPLVPSFGGCLYHGWPVCFLPEANQGSEPRL